MEDRVAVQAKKKIGDILLEGAFITPEQLQSALEISSQTRKRVGEILVEQGAITPETLATVLSFQLNVPIVDLNQFKIRPEALQLISENLAREYGVLPLSLDGDTLTVAMEEPQDLEALDTLSAIARKKIKPVIPLHGKIREAIDGNYKLTTQIKRQVSEVARGVNGRSAPEPAVTPDAIAQAPIVRALEMIIEQGIKDRASDIHIEPQEDELQVRYRIDGILHPAVSLPLGVHAALVSRVKVLAGMNIAERRRPQDGQFSLRIGEREVDFRVATAETHCGELMVMRVLDRSVSVHKLGDLGLQTGSLQAYERMLQSPYGMILVSGPTGSGKTTTLYASVNRLDATTRNIITIEDPIECRLKNINQIQVNRAADITFAAGLRAIMRLDPDVILVGEIRDAETASVAVQSALTGHLVLTSIHANDSVSAILRLIDFGIEPFVVTSAVIGAVGQRLVRRVCPHCRQMLAATPEERGFEGLRSSAVAYQQEMAELRTDFYYGQGCNFCSRTGYLGRIGVFEVLSMSEQVRALLAKQALASEIKEEALRDGMITMRRDGMLKARDGLTTPSEVVRNVFLIG